MNWNWKAGREMFAYFFRTGWYTFGGGWSIVAQIQKDYVEGKGELSEAELLDIVSVGRSLPGIMIGNVSYLFGHKRGGLAGGLGALAGISLPPLLILSVLTLCYTAVKDNLYIARALVGVRSVVVPIILSAALKLHKGAFPRPICYALCLGAAVLLLGFHVSCITVVLLGVAAGLLLPAQRKEESV